MKTIEERIKELLDGDLQVRIDAAESLSRHGGHRAVVPLIEALGDVSWIVRMLAALALSRLGDPRSVEALITALRDKSACVRKYAAIGLGVIGDPRAVEPLIETLENDGDDRVRLRIVYALCEIGGENAIDAIVDSLADDSVSVKMAASEASKAFSRRP